MASTEGQGVEDKIPNPYGILLQFTKIVGEHYPDYPKDLAPTEKEILFAEKMFDSFLQNLQEFVVEEDECLTLDETTFACDHLSDGYEYDQNEQPSEDDDCDQNNEQDEQLSDNESDDQNEQTDDDYLVETPAKKSKYKFVPFDRKQEILALWESHPKWSVTSLKKHGAKEVRNKQTLYLWKRQVKEKQDKKEKYARISQHVFNEMTEARKSFKIIRASHLRYWAMQKYIEIGDDNLKFKVSKSWLDRFKIRHGISSRKINTLVSKREIKSEQEILNSAKKFQEGIRNISSRFDPDHIFNTDQCGFSYEITSQRTLTKKGEKNVMGYAQSPKNLSTHSYTVQYLINLAGEVVGNVFICLQEAQGKLGPSVKKEVESYLPSNVTLTCSTSGKLSTSLNEYFIQKQLLPFVTKDFLYIIDSWAGQTNFESYSKYFGEQNEKPNITLKIIPEKCTPLAQPLDTTFHRQLKILAREILAGLEVFVNSEGVNQDDNWTTRKGIIKLQSLLHFMISAPIFKPMLQYAWYSSGLTDVKVDFLNMKQVCFSFTEDEGKLCESPGCDKPRFIKCARCRKRLCIFDLWVTNHFYFCECSPFKE
ncbi:Tigger transposable element-derived protein 6 [Folsomia candida]|uniref:Tigger transposable element-derived protein 6 n=1 Tax=Folsomia candida TaxID=158441 RepID=A0A226D518_FOLCA|nr:Tigger transposable element-derived protein 6 [Folsomia candida]